MAFSYKNTLEQALNRLPSKLSETVLTDTCDQVEKRVERANKLFSFNVRPEVSELLSQNGVELAPIPFKDHTHPASKMIENHILYVVLPNMLKRFPSVAFMSLRPEKMDRFIEMTQVLRYGNFGCFGMFNALIDAKDQYRYGDTGFYSFEDRVQGLADEISSNPGKKPPSIILMHDELHHLTPRQIILLFEKVRSIKRIVCTSIFPIELLYGSTTSREPRIYGLKVSDSNFYHYPDNCPSEGYIQDIATSSWPFLHNSISNGQIHLSVSRDYSLFSHHVITISRSGFCGKGDTVFYKKPSCLLAHELELLMPSFLEAQVERGTISSICLYLSCLKNPNTESALAKLRQIEKRELFQDELAIVSSLTTAAIAKGFKFPQRSDTFLNKIYNSTGIPCLVYNFREIFGLENHSFEEKIRLFLTAISDRVLVTHRSCLQLREKGPVVTVNLSHTDHKLKFNCGEEYTAGSSYLLPSKYIYNLNGSNLDSIETSEAREKLGTIKNSMDKGRKIKIKVPNTVTEPDSPGEKTETDSKTETNGEEKILFRRKLALAFLFSYLSRKKDESVKKSEPEEKAKVDLEASDSKEKEELPTESAPFRENSISDDHASLRPGFMDITSIEAMQKMNRINDFQCLKNNPRRERKNSCVFDAIYADAEFKSSTELMDFLCESDISDELFQAIEQDHGLTRDLIKEVAEITGLKLMCTEDLKKFYKLGPSKGKQVFLRIHKNHAEKINSNVISNEIKHSLDLQDDSQKDLSLRGFFDESLIKYKGSEFTALARSMLNGTTGVMGSEKSPVRDVLNRILKASRNFEELSVEALMRIGFAGSGKSKRILDMIHQEPHRKYLFISPRKNLAEQVNAKVRGTSCKVATFEIALGIINESYTDIVIDEISLIPPGYIALIWIAANFKNRPALNEKTLIKELKTSMENFKRSSRRLFIIGDCLQARYYNDMDDRILSQVTEVSRVIQGAETFHYVWQCYRAGTWFKKLFDIPTREDGSTFSLKVHGDLTTVNIQDFDCILCASQEEKKHFSLDVPVMTYGESEGLTFEKKTLIVLSHQASLVEPFSMIVALTRSKSGLEFMLNGITSVEVPRLFKRKLFLEILEGRQINLEKLKKLFIKEPTLVSDELIGTLEEKASNDLFILPFVDIVEPANPEEVVIEEIQTSPEWFKVHIPVLGANPMINEIFERMAAKEKREFRSLMDSSNQFSDLEKGLLKDEVYPMQFSSIFPKHHGDDDVTFWAGVKKRLRFSNPLEERRKLDNLELIGENLCEEFMSHLPQRFEVLQEDLERGLDSFNQRRAEKPAPLWANHAVRSDIDWKLDNIFLFIKSQLCTKEGKMFTEAKAAQTLACFQHIVLFKFGPVLRAIESAFIRAVGESYYIHSGKNFFCLDAFVTRNQELLDGRSIESDYEAFDSSQDATILAFELAVLKRIGLSADWIHDYKTLKLNVGCRLGHFAIMRFTGEFSTFLFNTFANMLFTFLTYNVDKKKSRILFAGDDMCSLGHLTERSDTKKLLQMFTLKAVKEIKPIPMFCGWYLTRYGILKSPRLLWARICLMKQRGLLKDCIDNYLFEAIFAYRLGERLFSFLENEAIEYHYLVNRFFIKNSVLLKGASKNLLAEIGESVGMALVKVKDFVRTAETSDMKINAIKSSEVYQDKSWISPLFSDTIKRFETNVKVMGSGPSNAIISEFSLLDQIELSKLKTAEGKFNYAHIGAIIGGITPMFPNHKNFGGRIVVYDGACLEPEHSIIASFKFDFSCGPAYFMFRPGHIFSLTDSNLIDRINMRIEFDCPRYKRDTELLAIDLGVMYRLSNHSRFLKDAYGTSGWSATAINGCTTLEWNEELIDLLRKPMECLALEDKGSRLMTQRRGLLMPDKVGRKRFLVAKKRQEPILNSFRSSSARMNIQEIGSDGESILSGGSCRSDQEAGRVSFSVGELHRPGPHPVGSGPFPAERTA